MHLFQSIKRYAFNDSISSSVHIATRMFRRRKSYNNKFTINEMAIDFDTPLVPYI